MNFRNLKPFGLALIAVVASLASCGHPKLQGGGYVSPNVLAGFGNWDGNGVGFGVYSKTGGVLGGTGVCLYQDTNGDGKLTCGELSGCAEKTSGAPEDYVIGGTSAGGGTVPPPGFICGKVAYRDDNGNDSSAAVCSLTKPGTPLDVCGLKACCPCVKCEEAAATDENGGHALRSALAAVPAGPLPPGPWYEWHGKSGELQMRVTHDTTGTNWTIVAGTVLAATSIEVLEVSTDGRILQRQALPTTTTSEGLSATWSGSPKADQYTVFSARASNRALLNFFVNETDRGTAKTKEYFEQVYAATFQ